MVYLNFNRAEEYNETLTNRKHSFYEIGTKVISAKTEYQNITNALVNSKNNLKERKNNNERK